MPGYTSEISEKNVNAKPVYTSNFNCHRVFRFSVWYSIGNTVVYAGVYSRVFQSVLYGLSVH